MRVSVSWSSSGGNKTVAHKITSSAASLLIQLLFIAAPQVCRMQVRTVSPGQQDLDISWTHGKNTAHCAVESVSFVTMTTAFSHHWPATCGRSEQTGTATWSTTASQTDRASKAEQRCNQTHLADHCGCGGKNSTLQFMTLLLINREAWVENYNSQVINLTNMAIWRL